MSAEIKAVKKEATEEGAVFDPAEAGRRGGLERARKLGKAKLREGASKAAKARWDGHVRGVAKATHVGDLTIGDLVLPCAVLDDGSRVLSERGVSNALGRWRSGSQFAEKTTTAAEERLPVFLMGKQLAAFVTADLRAALAQPKAYVDKRGGLPAHGFDAALLPEICEVWLRARDAHVLSEAQARVAEKADVLMRGLARVGVVALVDEATGYQAERDRDELHRILAAYIAKELMPWTKRFPDTFYEEMFRLRGWQRRSSKAPMMAGKLTNDVVYARMPPGVLEELQRVNPKDDRGRRKAKHHQYLSPDVGHPHLRDHVLQVTALMRAAESWGAFMRMLNRSFPRHGGKLDLELEIAAPHDEGEE